MNEVMSDDPPEDEVPLRLLVSAATCAVVIALTWPGVKAAAWAGVSAASVVVLRPEIAWC
jgi:hypothetical protein